MKNPCKSCDYAKCHAYGKTKKRHWYQCMSSKGECDNYKEYVNIHENELDAKRKFRMSSEIITDIDTLLSQEWVWIFGKPTHIAFVRSLQLNLVINMLNDGRIHRVIYRKQR